VGSIEIDLNFVRKLLRLRVNARALVSSRDVGFRAPSIHPNASHRSQPAFFLFIHPILIFTVYEPSITSDWWIFLVDPSRRGWRLVSLFTHT
jgi:hypothetical protein